MWMLENDIEKTIDRLLRYSPETADRLNVVFLPDGDSYITELIKDGNIITIKSCDWSNNRFYNIVDDLNISVTCLDEEENENWATICFSKGLLELLSHLSIDMELSVLEPADIREDLITMIDRLTRHLDISVRMSTITDEYILKFKENFLEFIKMSNMELDSDITILGWVSMNGSVMYIYDGTIRS